MRLENGIHVPEQIYCSTQRVFPIELGRHATSIFTHRPPSWLYTASISTAIWKTRDGRSDNHLYRFFEPFESCASPCWKNTGNRLFHCPFDGLPSAPLCQPRPLVTDLIFNWVQTTIILYYWSIFSFLSPFVIWSVKIYQVNEFSINCSALFSTLTWRY